MNPVVTILICTANRASFLRETLAAISKVETPEDIPAELIVVDNASTDGTADVARSFKMDRMDVRLVSEPKRGKGYAYNAGLAAARGGVVIFTDDDVVPPGDWIRSMSQPILDGETDALAGGIRIAPALLRDWMTPRMRGWLASTEGIPRENPASMFGANMSVSIKVLEKVPRFDPELGPGASGFGDELLFAKQLLEAGFRLGSALDCEVEHHFEPSRLLYRSWMDNAVKRGRSRAYITHHWSHARPRHPFLKRVLAQVKLLRLRASEGRRRLDEEGCSDLELELTRDIAFFTALPRESRRPRNYERHGLVKLREPK